jgi:hypothetical protein
VRGGATAFSIWAGPQKSWHRRFGYIASRYFNGFLTTNLPSLKMFLATNGWLSTFSNRLLESRPSTADAHADARTPFFFAWVCAQLQQIAGINAKRRLTLHIGARSGALFQQITAAGHARS